MPIALAAWNKCRRPTSAKRVSPQNNAGVGGNAGARLPQCEHFMASLQQDQQASSKE